MTREEFIDRIEKIPGYYYELEGDKIIIPKYCVKMDWAIESLPPGVEFRNSGSVILDSLKEIPSGTKFYNKAWVSLNAIKHVPDGVEFYNTSGVVMDEVVSISPGVEFNNGGAISMERLKVNTEFDWEFEVKGIDDKKVLNGMIKRGIFFKDK